MEVVSGDNPAVAYVPDRFRSYTINWLENLRDWNISRQIWWGHRLPVYTCTVCGQVIVRVDPPTSCDVCGGPLAQDEDTLDTWFSSALWPFAVLGWPDEDAFAVSLRRASIPPHLMITARDILYLWIVRMVMTGRGVHRARFPSRQVLVHPTVLNFEGRRMSKSLGTGVDPLEFIEKYGSDATRFSLLFQTGTDQDLRFGEERTEMARNFCNKIWNASRFALMNFPEDFTPADEGAGGDLRAEGSLAERWILSRYAAMLEAVNAGLVLLRNGRCGPGRLRILLVRVLRLVRGNGEVRRCARRARRRTRTQQTLWYLLEAHPARPAPLHALHHRRDLAATGRRRGVHDAGLLARGRGRVGGTKRPNGRWKPSCKSWWPRRKLRTEQNVPPSQRVKITVATAAEGIRRGAPRGRRGAAAARTRGEGLAFVGEGERPSVGEVVHCFGEPAFVGYRGAR